MVICQIREHPLDARALAAPVLAADPPGRLINVYGPTETTTFATFFDCPPESIAGRERIPIGFPLQQTTLRVLDEELRPVARGEPGELCIGGPGVAVGYLHRPELTARKFRPERSLPGAAAAGVDGEPAALLYRTGDVVRRLNDGSIEFLGRIDRQIKLRGYRIELEEIERAIMASGRVKTAVVEKVGDGFLAQLVAFVSPAADAESSTPADRLQVQDALAAAVRARLPAYMIPARWVLLSELPLAGTGKIDRARLLAALGPDGPGLQRGNTGAAPPGGTGATGTCAEVLDTLRELLEIREVRPGENFFDLGGNSIVAIQLAARLGDRFGVDVDPTDVLLTASVAELAARIAALQADRTATGLGDG